MSYYYLIAGLPDLEPEMDTGKIDFEEVAETIQRNLEPDDEKQFRYLLYPRDNRNLLNILWHKYKGFPKSSYVHPCAFDEGLMKEYRSQQSSFPNYIGEFLNVYEDQFPNMTPREMENRLWEGFYDEVHLQSAFVKGYFQFELKLKEILAAYNASYYNFLTPPSAMDEAILGQVGKGKSVTPALIREHSYIEELGEKISARSPKKLESFVAEIKWDYLQQHVKHDFSKEHVFAYGLKLLLVHDSHLRKQSASSSHFEELQKGITNQIQAKITSII